MVICVYAMNLSNQCAPSVLVFRVYNKMVRSVQAVRRVMLVEAGLRLDMPIGVVEAGVPASILKLYLG
jgi:hypothetical protein